MIRWVGWSFVFLFFTQVAYGIDALPAHAVFYEQKAGGEVSPYIELYWQVDPRSVEFSIDDKEIWRAKITTILEVRHDTGLVAYEKYYLQTTPAASLPAARLQNILDLQRFSVAPGMVNIKLMLYQDGQTIPAFVYTDSIEIKKQPSLGYSDIQLLDTAYESVDEGNVFVKNGYLQVPQCINFLDDYRKMMHYYVELYGADGVEAKDLPIIQYTSISKKEFDYPSHGLERTDTLKPADLLVQSGDFNLERLPSGNYYLNFVLKNAKGSDIARKSLFFQRSNIHPVVVADTNKADSLPMFEKVTLFDLSTTFVEKYTPAQLKAILKMVKPIATEVEMLNINGFVKRPEETFMRYFVYNFWKARNAVEPEKAWEDYTDRVKEVNRLFAGESKPGYETDRGYYYLKYGVPDQRQIVTSEQGALPYEVWQYNAPGKQSYEGAFLFYNPGFMGNDYRVLHSTVAGEVLNGNWQAELYRNSVPGGNNNSRAMQVFTR